MTAWSAVRAPLSAHGVGRALLCALLTAALAGFGLAGVAAADTGTNDVDQNTLTARPSTVPAGGLATFTLTYTNSPGNAEAANGADITVPAGFSPVRAGLTAGEAGAAAISGDTVALTGLNDGPGKPLTVTVTARVPAVCGRSTHTWSSTSWENDSGFPGGHEPMTLVGGEPVTTVQTPCRAEYSLSVHARSIRAGTPAVFSVSVHNRSSVGAALSSASIAIPRSIQARRASVSTGHAQLMLRTHVLRLVGLTLRPGRTETVRLVAVAPVDCGRSSYVWRSSAVIHGHSVAAGGPASARTTNVTTPCTLRFVTEPHSAAVGTHITGSDFNPTGPPVSVEVRAFGRRVTSARTAIRVGLRTNPGNASLTGTTTVTAVRGVASFATLSLGTAASGYALSASGSAASSAASTAFDESNAGAACAQNITCSTVVKSTESSLQVVATPDTSATNAGSLMESLDLGTALACSGYTPVDINWYSFTMTSDNRSKQVGYTVSEPFPTNTTTPEPIEDTVQVCYGAPYEFTTSAGTPALAVTLPDGSSGYAGLLPTCPSAGGPCLEPITSLPSSDNYICSEDNPFIWTAVCGTTTLTIDIPVGDSQEIPGCAPDGRGRAPLQRGDRHSRDLEAVKDGVALGEHLRVGDAERLQDGDGRRGVVFVPALACRGERRQQLELCIIRPSEPRERDPEHAASRGRLRSDAANACRAISMDRSASPANASASATRATARSA